MHRRVIELAVYIRTDQPTLVWGDLGLLDAGLYRKLIREGRLPASSQVGTFPHFMRADTALVLPAGTACIEALKAIQDAVRKSGRRDLRFTLPPDDGHYEAVLDELGAVVSSS